MFVNKEKLLEEKKCDESTAKAMHNIVFVQFSTPYIVKVRHPLFEKNIHRWTKNK
jgi:hypothetical protein